MHSISNIADPCYSSNNYKISFRGDSIAFFKIWITNLLLTICTLGIYYPWGRARAKKYLYSSTYFDEYNFEFHGTGKQMFKGLVKFLIIIFLLFVVFVTIFTIASGFEEGSLIETFVGLSIYVIYAPILALFIHGARRYGMAKTSYKGIRFGYRGVKKSLVLLMVRDTLITLITFGIYYPWFINNVRKYIYNNTRFGNIQINFQGKGEDYCKNLVIGWILTIITFGILYFWFKKLLFNFFYENVYFSKDDQFVKIKSNATGWKYFKLISLNWLIILFTLGLGYPLAKVRSIKFIADNLEFHGNLDLNDVIQTEGNYSDATGDAETDLDSSADFFDLDIF